MVVLTCNPTAGEESGWGSLGTYIATSVRPRPVRQVWGPDEMAPWYWISGSLLCLEMNQDGLWKDIWQLDKSQHSTGTCETGP